MRDKFVIEDGDIGFLRISAGAVAKTVEPCENILVDLDATGAPLSIEVVGFSQVSDEQIIEAVAPFLVQKRIVYSGHVSYGLNSGRQTEPQGVSFHRTISKESVTCGI